MLLGMLSFTERGSSAQLTYVVPSGLSVSQPSLQQGAQRHRSTRRVVQLVKTLAPRSSFDRRDASAAPNPPLLFQHQKALTPSELSILSHFVSHLHTSRFHIAPLLIPNTIHRD